jgi:hypothetical protein
VIPDGKTEAATKWSCSSLRDPSASVTESIQASANEFAFIRREGRKQSSKMASSDLRSVDRDDQSCEMRRHSLASCESRRCCPNSRFTGAGQSDGSCSRRRGPRQCRLARVGALTLARPFELFQTPSGSEVLGRERLLTEGTEIHQNAPSRLRRLRASDISMWILTIRLRNVGTDAFSMMLQIAIIQNVQVTGRFANMRLNAP